MGITALCVFCGSSDGARPVYLETARELGRTLAERGLRLVYGGADRGLMGALADAALGAGGEVVGVIPRGLVELERAHTGLDDLRVVDSMSERKALMADLADGFIALPGGVGTLEELIEVLSWARLGLHAKPCGVLDVQGFYAPLFALLDSWVAEGFVAAADRDRLARARTVEALLGALRV